MVSEDYIDFHAHHPSLRGERVIQDGIDTRGRHPWHLASTPPHKGGGWEGVCAVGESGLDKACSTPYDLQLQVFREEVLMSEQLKKPLFLHCVRAIDDVLRIRRELGVTQPWIWHGYRGNAKQIEQLLKTKGDDEMGTFYFSFGFRFNEEAVKACPLDHLLLETDEDTQHPIAELYEQVASLRGITTDELIQQMHKNFNTIFQRSTP